MSGCGGPWAWPPFDEPDYLPLTSYDAAQPPVALCRVWNLLPLHVSTDHLPTFCFYLLSVLCPLIPSTHPVTTLPDFKCCLAPVFVVEGRRGGTPILGWWGAPATPGYLPVIFRSCPGNTCIPQSLTLTPIALCCGLERGRASLEVCLSPSWQPEELPQEACAFICIRHTATHHAAASRGAHGTKQPAPLGLMSAPRTPLSSWTSS